MTQEGLVLELYVYYKALEENYFDDVVSGCEIIWDKNAETKNEFDLVLTKGWKFLLVECKAQTQLKQDFYTKLSHLNQKFGINSKSVLIADTFELDWFDNSQNDMQRNRGNDECVRVETVYKFEDIQQNNKNPGIGATLRRIMEELK